MKRTAYERETLINYNMADCEATVYTHDKKLITRLEKLAAKYPEEFRLKDRSLYGDATYIFPKKYITIREAVQRGTASGGEGTGHKRQFSAAAQRY